MAVQVVVTFGHVNLDGLSRAAAHAGQQAAAGGAVASSASARGDDRQSPGKADVDCSICALIQLASSSAPSVAPPLPIPLARGGTILETSESPAVAASPTSAFQARGPPAV